MKNDPLIVITRDAIHESLSLQTEEERTRHSSPKLKRRSCVINHESNPEVRQYLLQEMTLWNVPTTGLDHEVNFLSFTWGVHSDCESPFREESLSPCLWRGVRAFVCLWDNWAPASDVGLGRLFVSGIQSTLDYNWVPWLVQMFSGNFWFFQTRTRSLNPTELTSWVITKVEQSQKAENTHTVYGGDRKVSLHKVRIIPRAQC